jgi:hypothetical protein
MNKLRIFSALVMSLVAFGVGSVPAAQAAPPTFTEEHYVGDVYSAPRLTALCGFTVTRQDDVWIRFITLEDGNGNLRREISQWRGATTLSGNSGSILAEWREMQNVQYFEEESMRVVIAGMSYWVIVPGSGPAFGGTGSLRMEWENGIMISMETSGPQFLDSAICRLLGTPTAP